MEDISLGIQEYRRLKGQPIIDEGTGHPRVGKHSLIKQAYDVARDTSGPENAYIPAGGSMEARGSGARFLNFCISLGMNHDHTSQSNFFPPFSAENALIFTGSTEGYSNIYQALRKLYPKKDTIVSLQSIYSAQNAELRGMGFNTVNLSGSRDNSFCLDSVDAYNQAFAPYKDKTILIQDGSQNPYSMIASPENTKIKADFLNTHSDIPAYFDFPYYFISAHPEVLTPRYVSEDVARNSFYSHSVSKIGGDPGTCGVIASHRQDVINLMLQDNVNYRLSIPQLVEEQAKLFFSGVIREFNQLAFESWKGGQADPVLSALHNWEIAKNTAEPYLKNQAHLMNMLRGSMESLGFTGELVTLDHNSGMYVNLFLDQLKGKKFSDKKVLFGGQYSFVDVMGKDSIESGEDLKKFLSILDGLPTEPRASITSRSGEMFNLDANHVGVRLCHTNGDALNEKACEVIYNGLALAYVIEQNKEFSVIKNESKIKSEKMVNDAFQYRRA
ncbi:MAG: hypothetical protein SFT90_03075 [Rickettsiales bacterium]|nr:hypothetical protein [Rickettsiales bacterium]